jgi:hypothetical protein
MALVLCAYLVLLGRLAYWQVWRHSDMAQLAAAYHDDTITLPAVRGNILDRNGATLVTNTPVFSIFASPDQLSAAERKDVATKLAPLLQLSAADIEAKLASARQFVYLARRVPASVAHQLDAMRLPGIGKVGETQRSYVDGGVAGTTLAANLLGFANDEGQGNYGVEGYYNKTLAGQAGFEATVRDLANRPIVLSDRQRREPVNGMTLQLSLDSTIQVVAERALAEGVQKYQAESGSLIIMEPATGRIVAWADVPSYNANQFATTPTAQFIDPIVSSLYEPGSVMKVVTLCGALDDHAITPDTRFNETGVAVVGGVAIHNWDNRAHGNVTMTQVLQNSLNVGAIKAQQMEGAAPFYQYLQKFGIGHGVLRPGGRHHPDRDAGRDQRGGQRRQSRLAARRRPGDRRQRGPPPGSAAHPPAGRQRQDRAADAADDGPGGRARLRIRRPHRRLQEPDRRQDRDSEHPGEREISSGRDHRLLRRLRSGRPPAVHHAGDHPQAEGPLRRCVRRRPHLEGRRQRADHPVADRAVSPWMKGTARIVSLWVCP